MLSVRNLAVPGLAPIAFDLDAGECVALSGPSGSGKTLMLRALADLDPNEGEVVLDGEVRESVPGPAWRRRVCYLAAESSWWADTVGDHFPDRAAARALLPELKLAPEFLDRIVATASTGERQRLALARVLLLAPKVMLLDEPTSGLDDEAAACVERVLVERLAGGGAILLVTHDADLAGRLGKRRLRIVNGRVEAIE